MRKWILVAAVILLGAAGCASVSVKAPFCLFNCGESEIRGGI